MFCQQQEVQMSQTGKPFWRWGGSDGRGAERGSGGERERETLLLDDCVLLFCQFWVQKTFSY